MPYWNQLAMSRESHIIYTKYTQLQRLVNLGEYPSHKAS